MIYTPHDVMALPPSNFLRRPYIEQVTGLKRSSIYDAIREGRFPAPVKITRTASGWRAGAIQKWLQDPAAWRADAAENIAP